MSEMKMLEKDSSGEYVEVDHIGVGTATRIFQALAEIFGRREGAEITITDVRERGEESDIA